MTTYRVVRHYRDEPENNTIIKEGLTLAEAQAHCCDPETSSETARSNWAQIETAEHGPWFDGYYSETPKD